MSDSTTFCRSKLNSWSMYRPSRIALLAPTWSNRMRREDIPGPRSSTKRQQAPRASRGACRVSGLSPGMGLGLLAHDWCEEASQLFPRAQWQDVRNIHVRTNNHDRAFARDLAFVEDVGIFQCGVDLFVVHETELADVRTEHLRCVIDVHRGVILLVDHLDV